MNNEQESVSPNASETYSSEFVPQADTISTEAITNMLVSKGICTVEEIFILEGRIQEKNKELRKENITKIANLHNNHHGHRQHHSGMKRFFSAFRWTRHLGTKLFGWKWKKVKRSSSIESIHEE